MSEGIIKDVMAKAVEGIAKKAAVDVAVGIVDVVQKGKKQ